MEACWPNSWQSSMCEKPGDGMPIAGVAGCKRRLNIFPFQTALNVRIGRDVIGVVVIDEIVSQRGDVDGKCHEGQQEQSRGG